ncbi:MAG TPA: AIR synthase-related protein, partial [Draconibacterium sp.]|nr:AIR synthase-related protein [Draconibacterium sp.]
VTGFGLLGHLTEMCEGSNLSAQIEYEKIPTLPMLQPYLQQNCIPGGTLRNWDSYGHNVSMKNEAYKNILCDPQTSGGLLLAVEPEALPEVEACLAKFNIQVTPFGQLIEKEEQLITVV